LVFGVWGAVDLGVGRHVVAVPAPMLPERRNNLPISTVSVHALMDFTNGDWQVDAVAEFSGRCECQARSPQSSGGQRRNALHRLGCGSILGSNSHILRNASRRAISGRSCVQREQMRIAAARALVFLPRRPGCSKGVFPEQIPPHNNSKKAFPARDSAQAPIPPRVDSIPVRVQTHQIRMLSAPDTHAVSKPALERQSGSRQG
jgi:hypothetical protein